MEYSAVFDAMERIAMGDFDEEALEFAVWKQDNGTWSSCELWRMHEIMTDQQEVAMFKASSIQILRCFNSCSTYKLDLLN